jgi:hypothetical protein
MDGVALGPMELKLNLAGRRRATMMNKLLLGLIGLLVVAAIIPVAGIPRNDATGDRQLFLSTVDEFRRTRV